MKTINLKTVSTDVGVSLIKKSQKITIRDVDEETKNYFVAYADENDQSFDVAITLDTKQNVVETNCDCELGGICLHKIALIAQLATTKTKPVVTRTKKSSPAETIINCLEENELRNWVIDLLKTNKEIEFLFINKFAVANEDFTKSDIAKLIQDAIKSVIKTRKKVETNELKKIIDVLEISLKPVTIRLLAKFYDKESTELLLFIFETLINFDNNLYSNSVKIIRFIEKIADQFIAYLSILNDDTAWNNIIDYHFEFKLSSTASRVERGIFIYLKNIYYETTAENRKLYFAKKLEAYYIQVSKQYTIENEVNLFILETNIESELFSSAFFQFKCHRFQNEYNLMFIDNLIIINQIELAKKYCLEQINSNYQSEYDIPYLQRLKVILKSEKKISELAKVLMLTIPFELDFEDYLIIANNTPDDVFKKFKTTFTANVKRKFDYGPEYSSIYFKILALDKNYKKMLDSIDQYTDYDIIYPHREELYQLDTFTFFYNLANVETNNYRSKKYEYNQEYRQKLIDWFFEEKQRESINLFYKNRLHLRLNSKFFDSITLKLQNENLNQNN